MGKEKTMRLIDVDVLEKEIYKWMPKDQEAWMDSEIPPIENLVVSIMMTIQEQETIDAVPVIRCKDCKHRPIVIDAEGNGFDYDFPDERCPCQCEDGWYNWMPRDEWYCANAERKEE